MGEQLSKVYEPTTVEKWANEIWFSHSYFHAEASPDRGGPAQGPYTIVIPPPNVTAPLHVGHALNNTLQDVLIRFRRMQNYNTLWMPGTDHAGIATQTVVEKQILSEEGKRRTDFQREEFVARVQAWKDEYEARIIEQLQAMGCSCDWQRTRFTMDEVCAKAVRAAFFKLFKDGLIYRGKRLVNWDPATQTVLADDEVEHETVKGHFWYLRYPLDEPVEISGERVEYITVATTRPETMLGDTAVAMNPTDKRAEYLLGKKVRLPIVGRIIPIIADEHVVLPDPDSEDEKAKFSTGFLKVTPAHDPDDWEIGQRHGLEIVNVMAPDGSISDKYGWEDATAPEAQALLGMDRFEAREAIVEWFRQENLLEDVREYVHEVGHSYRSHVPIEPYLSDQWYIAVKKPIKWHGLPAREDTAKPVPSEVEGMAVPPLIEGTDVPVNSLAGLALQPLLDGRLRFIPERYAKTYQSWLENLRDWPISRQLWWGHRIPMWSKLGGGGQLVNELSKLPDKVCSELTDSDEGPITYICVTPGNEDIEKQLVDNGFKRDEDVLDTWFSSALWPFSTMGWPDDTPELKTFYPGNVLCTAREIITLWVSRMVMMGQYCAGDIPFSDVYIHAMIQDGEGRKMSKSLGNGIDPLVAINSHGADAMRFTLASMTTDTQDIRMPVQKMKLPDGREENTSPKFDIGRNFCNKLWNASRFALMNLEGIEPGKFDKDKMTITDRWILSRLTRTIAETTKSLEEFKYAEPLAQLYRFFWNDFCDWYLEWIKPRMQDEQQKPIAQNVLAFVLDQILRLLHPFVPFITEGIFQKLNEITPARKLEGLAEAGQAKALVVAEWPGEVNSLINTAIEGEINLIQDVITAIRDVRSKHSVHPKRLIPVYAFAKYEIVTSLNRNRSLIKKLAVLSNFQAGIDITRPANAVAAIVDNVQIFVGDIVDPKVEQQRLEKQKQRLDRAKKSTEAKLANDNFITKAKPEVVEQAKARLTELAEQLEAVEKHLSELES
ncbi:MAG TPA: valine--tRNA ligase [Sedimentisphaerales bacterium]|nr:valine--tRNA ligase [Sedimentisphaerales bacterium]